MKTRKVYENLIIILLYITVFQDFVLGILYNFTGQVTLVKTLFFTKDFLMVFLFIWALARRKYSNKLLLFLAIYFTILVIQSVVSILEGIELFNILSSLRGWLLLPCLVIIGYAIKNKKHFIKQLKIFIGPFMVIVAIFGLFDFIMDSYVVSTLPFWKDFVGIGKFMEDIKGQDTLFGLPGNFYGQYGGEFFSQKRLVSFWGGPLTSGYVLAIPTIYFFYKSFIICKKIRCRYFFSFLIVFAALICTYTRAIILTTLVLMFLILFNRKKKYRKYILELCVVILAILLLELDKVTGYIFDGSLIEHVRQFTDSIKQISLFGSGIATFGVRTSIGTESAYISSFGQNGIIFFIMYLIGNLLPLYYLYKMRRRNKNNALINTILIVGIIMLISGLISEQLIAYTTIAPYYIILGYLVSHKRMPKSYRCIQYIKTKECYNA